MKLIFDASCLITTAKFKLGKRIILDFIVGAHKVIIPPMIKKETVDEGINLGYADAVEIRTRIEQGVISISPVSGNLPVLEEILNGYGVEKGDREVLRLAKDIADCDFLVTDDQILYIIAHRLEFKPVFLPDLIWKITKMGTIKREEALRILSEIKPRYRRGFIEHTIKMVEGVI